MRRSATQGSLATDRPSTEEILKAPGQSRLCLIEKRDEQIRRQQILDPVKTGNLKRKTMKPSLMSSSPGF